MNKNLCNKLANILEDYSIEELETKRKKLSSWSDYHHARGIWSSTHYDKPWKERKYSCRDCVSIGSVVIWYEINYSLNDFWHENFWIDGSDEKVSFGDIGFLLGQIEIIRIRKRKNSVKEV